MASDVILNPELLGTDIATGTNGDLLPDGSDAGTVSGVLNTINAFVRELTTPFGYLAKYVEDAEGLKLLNEKYGNPGYFLLSEPLDQVWLDTMIEAIEAVADNQPRIELIQVDHEILSGTKVHFMIRFKVLSSPREFNMVLTKENNALAVTQLR